MLVPHEYNQWDKEDPDLWDDPLHEEARNKADAVLANSVLTDDEYNDEWERLVADFYAQLQQAAQNLLHEIEQIRSSTDDDFDNEGYDDEGYDDDCGLFVTEEGQYQCTGIGIEDCYWCPYHMMIGSDVPDGEGEP